MESLGKTLKMIRAKCSLTQTQAAEKIGIEQSYLSKLESDQAWASLEVLKRLCTVYKVDIKTLLRQIDQHSLRGNLEYQGFLQREEDRKKNVWLLFNGMVGVLCILVISFFLLNHTLYSAEPKPLHTPLSLNMKDVDGQTVLQLIADYGDLTIHEIGQVKGSIVTLKLKSEPWDTALAKVASELGYRVEITGREVYLTPIKNLHGTENVFDNQ